MGKVNGNSNGDVEAAPVDTHAQDGDLVMGFVGIPNCTDHKFSACPPPLRPHPSRAISEVRGHVTHTPRAKPRRPPGPQGANYSMFRVSNFPYQNAMQDSPLIHSSPKAKSARCRLETIYRVLRIDCLPLRSDLVLIYSVLALCTATPTASCSMRPQDDLCMQRGAAFD